MAESVAQPADGCQAGQMSGNIKARCAQLPPVLRSRRQKDSRFENGAVRIVVGQALVILYKWNKLTRTEGSRKRRNLG